MTVLVTTAYLDEAERCNRVGLMNQGRLIRCDTPGPEHRLEEFTVPTPRAREICRAAGVLA